MIRRSITLRDGRPGWALIPQQAHAQLAADLARHWKSLDEFAPSGHESDLLHAITHHDDGWDDWDGHWYEHTAGGMVPTSFNEMVPADSNRIWDRSIQQVQAQGPFVTYLVARHFVRMRERSSTDDPSGSSKSFIDRNRALCEQAFHTWREQSERASADIELVELAVDTLQFFDNLSLILCLGKYLNPIELTPPLPPAIKLRFVWPRFFDVRVDPNPFVESDLSFEVEILEIPDSWLDAKTLKRYARPGTLTWHLIG